MRWASTPLGPTPYVGDRGAAGWALAARLRARRRGAARWRAGRCCHILRPLAQPAGGQRCWSDGQSRSYSTVRTVHV